MFDEEDRQCLHPIYDFGPDLGVARNHQFGDALIAANTPRELFSRPSNSGEVLGEGRHLASPYSAIERIESKIMPCFIFYCSLVALKADSVCNRTKISSQRRIYGKPSYRHS
jgi:hypothetical protein